MGNLSSCCTSSNDETVRCCLQEKGPTKSKKMVPADLHSSGAQGSTKKRDSHRQKGEPRPNTLQTQSGDASTSNPKSQNNIKYSEFSLHGVQKTSPVGNSDESLTMQERGIQQKFLVENVATFFENYKDKDCDEILEEGIDKFCNDLKVDPAEFIVLALAWKFKAATMCKFSRDEFTKGCIALHADSIQTLTEAFPSLEKEAMKNFKDLYKFAFQFGLDTEQGQRSLPCEVAIGMWQVVFANNTPALLNEWIKFLEDNQIRGISRDTWNMFLHFTENVGTDLKNYDDSEAWPSLFDDFVEYFRNKQEEMEKNKEDEKSDDDLSPSSIPDKDVGTYHVILEPSDHADVKPVETEDSNPENVPLQEDSLKDNVTDPPSDLDNTKLEEIVENGSIGPPVTEQDNNEVDSEPITTNTLHSSS